MEPEFDQKADGCQPKTRYIKLMHDDAGAEGQASALGMGGGAASVPSARVGVLKDGDGMQLSRFERNFTPDIWIDNTAVAPLPGRAVLNCQR